MSLSALDKSVQRFLEEAAEALETLSAEWGARPPYPPLLTLLFTTSLLILSQPNPPMAVLSWTLILSAATLALALLGVGFGRLEGLLKATGFLLLFTIIVALPLLAYKPHLFLAFTARVGVIAVETVAVLAVAGWQPLLAGVACLGFPAELAAAMELMLRFIPQLSRDASRALEARRARSLGRLSLTSSWRVLATGLSYLLEKSYVRAYKLSMAIRARRIGVFWVEPGRRGCLSRGRGWPGILAYLPPVAVIASYVVTVLA